MNSTEVKNIIKDELKDILDLAIVFGLNLNNCLIEPIKQEYQTFSDSNITNELWTVLEEISDKSGYKITFDDEEKLFGLGILTNTNELVDIGFYGTFLETLRGM
ncbi:MAG: hypothetical protein ABF242_06405 [Flavobacteriales bacterium]